MGRLAIILLPLFFWVGCHAFQGVVKLFGEEESPDWEAEERTIVVNNEIETPKTNRWRVLGDGFVSEGGGVYTSIVFYKNECYVGYTDYFHQTNSTVRKWNGEAWVTMGSNGFSAYQVGRTALFVYENELYAAYSDLTNFLYVTMTKWNGSYWEEMGKGEFKAGDLNCLSINSYKNTIFAAYRDNMTAKTTVKQLEIFGWKLVGDGGFSEGEGYWNSLFVYKYMPYVAFVDRGRGNKTVLKRYHKKEWEDLGFVSDGESAYCSVFVYRGVPFVVYQDYANGKRATLKTYDGSQWLTMGNAGFTEDSASYLGLWVHQGVPYVVLTDTSSRIRVMVYDNQGE